MNKKIIQRLGPQEWMSDMGVTAIFEAVNRAGGRVRFVGGCVRDALLNRPSMNIDLATDLLPGRVIKVLEESDIKVVPIGLTYGTVMAITDTLTIDITTLRRDVETYGRHAKVEFTDDWKEDASRRDFTINAISLELDGTLYDPFDGHRDLLDRQVRFVGTAKERIKEDILRLLRYFRFFAHFGRLPANPEALAACREMAPMLTQLSKERVRAEFFKLMGASSAADVLHLMNEEGILKYILPYEIHCDRLSRLIELEGRLNLIDPIRRLAALVELDSRRLVELQKIFNLSKEEKTRLATYVKYRPSIKPTMEYLERDIILYRLGISVFRDLVLLCWACAGKNEGWEKLMLSCNDWQPKKLPIGGADILEGGAKSGPEVGRLLKELENWWILDGFVADRNSCLKRLKELIENTPI